jgi:hypothetical protein
VAVDVDGRYFMRRRRDGKQVSKVLFAAMVSFILFTNSNINLAFFEIEKLDK